MKLVTFKDDGAVCAGLLDGDEVVVCETGAEADRAVGRIAAGDTDRLETWKKLSSDGGTRRPLGRVTLLAPIPEPRRDILCVGKNYYAHASEFHNSGFDSSGKEEVPSAPVIFTKATTSVIGPDAEINATLDHTNTTDYEGEFAVVIGKRAFNVSKADAMDVIFGYTIINDVTSRELQRFHSQWVIGKSLDTFCPMGPVLVTADEIEDVTSLTLTTTVNGEVRQKAALTDLIFDIPTLIETMSRTMTLVPGDIIATGTPAGVGLGFKPPRYLKDGDRVAITVDGIGTLENPVRD